MRWSPLLVLGLACGCAGCGPPARVKASGHAFQFSPEGGRLVGAEVRVLEMPEKRTTTGRDGAWEIPNLLQGRLATFVLRAPGFAETQTATFTVGNEDIERISFQAPTDDIIKLFSGVAGERPEADRCQLSSTVTRQGNSLYDDEEGNFGTHGEPGATVTVDPPLPEDRGPIYFNLIKANLIFPDRRLKQTTDDGGVVFINVPPGTYRLRAEKPDAEFAEVTLKCRAGVLVNASPPWGLQAIEGGVGWRSPDAGTGEPDLRAVNGGDADAPDGG